MSKQLIKLISQTITITFLIAVCWEFFMEDFVSGFLGCGTGEIENFESKIEYLITITIFVAIALILPSWFAIKAERKKKNTEAKLLELATVFQFASESIIITDQNTVIQNVNPAFTLLNGYTAEEVIGKTPRIIRSHKQDKDFYQTMWTALLKYGKWQGEIWNKRKNGDLYPALLSIVAIHPDAKLTRYAGIAMDITKRKQYEGVIQHQAFHDPLTDLPNRQLFQDRLNICIAHSQRQSKKFAVMFIDLDNFKNVNDQYGHHTGDHLLITVSKSFSTCVRKADTVARMGGDEFALLLTDVQTNMDCCRVADAILESLNKAIHVENHDFFIRASIGIAIYPSDGLSYEDLLKNADIAMYKAKDSGKNNYKFFSS